MRLSLNYNNVLFMEKLYVFIHIGKCAGLTIRDNIENSIRMLAGSMIVLSLVLYYFVSPYWLLLTGFVGLNLLQSSVTKFCPAEIIIKKLFYAK